MSKKDDLIKTKKFRPSLTIADLSVINEAMNSSKLYSGSNTHNNIRAYLAKVLIESGLVTVDGILGGNGSNPRTESVSHDETSILTSGTEVTRETSRDSLIDSLAESVSEHSEYTDTYQRLFMSDANFAQLSNHEQNRKIVQIIHSDLLREAN